MKVQHSLRQPLQDQEKKGLTSAILPALGKRIIREVRANPGGSATEVKGNWSHQTITKFIKSK